MKWRLFPFLFKKELPAEGRLFLLPFSRAPRPSWAESGAKAAAPIASKTAPVAREYRTREPSFDSAVVVVTSESPLDRVLYVFFSCGCWAKQFLSCSFIVIGGWYSVCPGAKDQENEIWDTAGDEHYFRRSAVYSDASRKRSKAPPRLTSVTLPTSQLLSEPGPTFGFEDVSLPNPLTLILYGDQRFTDPTNTVSADPKVRAWLAKRIAAERPAGDYP